MLMRVQQDTMSALASERNSGDKHGIALADNDDCDL